MTTLLVVAVLLGLLWLVVSIAGMVYPFRPFASRKRAARSLGLTAVAVVVAMISLGSMTETTRVAGLPPDGAAVVPPPTEAIETASPGGIEDNGVEAYAEGVPVERPMPRIAGVATADGSLLGDPTGVCDPDARPSDRLLASKPSVLLRSGPATDAPGIVNERATRALNSTTYYNLDGSHELLEVCHQDNAVLVEVAWPNVHKGLRGWVSSADVRPIEFSAQGDRILIEEDFYWDEDIATHKAAIVAAVNRIQAENSRCNRADPGGVLRSQDSTPSDPIFFVICTTERGESFNVEFRLDDSSFAARRAVDRGTAALACEAAAKAAASHPSSVDFSHFLDLVFQDFPDGRAVVRSSFSARNSFNLELEYCINCFFEGATLADVEIYEAR